jgi:hypothetical protein
MVKYLRLALVVEVVVVNLSVCGTSAGTEEEVIRVDAEMGIKVEVGAGSS